MKIDHELKIFPYYFIQAYIGQKKFDIRINDKGFREEDIIKFEEYIGYPTGGGLYTGNSLIVKITSILDKYDGLKPGYIIFSFIILKAKPMLCAILGDLQELQKKYGHNVA